MLKTIKNHIIFQFEDEIIKKSDQGYTRTQFSEKTDWGFEMSNYDDGAKSPRWGFVAAVGHECMSDIHVGSKILVEALQWSEAFELGEERFWRTDDTKVMAIDESYSL